ncbi:HK97 family phage prohead protease [candidate division TA06 bacterium]|nr:HK97 family phage prohead protease [candidate division TA06 bacterium]
MSAEARDSDGEIIPISDFRKTMNTYMMRGGFIIDQHSNRVIGKTLNWKEKDIVTKKGDTVQGIIIDYQIFDDYSIDDQVWEEIKDGTRKGLSFGGRALNDPEIKMDAQSGELTRHLTGIEAYEISSVTEPANQYAKNVAINYLAKAKGRHQKAQSTKADKERGVNNMPKDTKKDDIHAPEEDMGMESGIEERVGAIEAKLDEIISLISAEKGEHEDEEEKVDEDNHEEEDVEMSKEADSGGEGEPEIQGISGEQPAGEGEDVVLPKANAGETDEDAKVEGDEVTVMEKAVEAVLKKYGFTKTRGKRPATELKKKAPRGDLALDLMKQLREGKITNAEMNREIKDRMVSGRRERIKNHLDSFKAEGEE